VTRYNRTVRQTRTRRVDYAALAEWRYQLRLLISRRETAARAAGIEPQQYVLLLQLKGLQDGGAVTIGKLAERLQVQHHSAVELVDRLVERRMVARRRDDGDRRQVVVTLRPAGEAVLRRLALYSLAELRTEAPSLLATLRRLVRSANGSRAVNDTPRRRGAMKATALVVQGLLLVGLAAGCAMTPATTTTATPSPDGTAMTGPSGSRMEGSTRQAAAGGSTTRVPIASFRPAVAGTLNDIHFDFDRYELSPEATQMLDANAEWLKANPKSLLLIEGHADERGTVAYNLALGERRAKATQNYLAAHGIQSGRVSIVSYGEERPQCSDRTEDCWAKNRRAHFMVKAQ